MHEGFHYWGITGDALNACKYIIKYRFDPGKSSFTRFLKVNIKKKYEPLFTDEVKLILKTALSKYYGGAITVYYHWL